MDHHIVSARVSERGENRAAKRIVEFGLRDHLPILGLPNFQPHRIPIQLCDRPQRTAGAEAAGYKRSLHTMNRFKAYRGEKLERSVVNNCEQCPCVGNSYFVSILRKAKPNPGVATGRAYRGNTASRS